MFSTKLRSRKTFLKVKLFCYLCCDIKTKAFWMSSNMIGWYIRGTKCWLKVNFMLFYPHAVTLRSVFHLQSYFVSTVGVSWPVETSRFFFHYIFVQDIQIFITRKSYFGCFSHMSCVELPGAGPHICVHNMESCGCNFAWHGTVTWSSNEGRPCATGALPPPHVTLKAKRKPSPSSQYHHENVRLLETLIWLKGQIFN